MPHSVATTSPALPMWQCSNAHHRPSLIIESSDLTVAHAQALRARARSRYGALLIDSMPPATTTRGRRWRSPARASITAFSPDPHTLLMVSAATWSDSPPRSAACRAGAWPRPAETTLPMMHSSTTRGSMPARRTASRTTSAPSCGAVKSLSAPRNLPVGRRDGGDDDRFHASMLTPLGGDPVVSSAAAGPGRGWRSAWAQKSSSSRLLFFMIGWIVYVIVDGFRRRQQTQGLHRVSRQAARSHRLGQGVRRVLQPATPGLGS